MQVFRLFFKLIKNVSPTILIITILFTIYIFVFMDKGSNNQVNNNEMKLAVIHNNNNNNEDVIGKQFISILENYCIIYEYYNDEELLNDKLNVMDMDGILSLPFGLTSDLLNGNKNIFALQNISGSGYLTYVEDFIKLYINTAKNYVSSNNDITQEELIRNLAATFATTGEAKQLVQRDTRIHYKYYEQYFRIAALLVFVVCFIGTGRALHSFEKLSIHRRNLMSPLSDRNRNLQIFLANILFILLYNLIIIILSLIYYRPMYLDQYFIFFCVNLIIFSFSGLSMSFVVSLLTKKKEVYAVLAIILPLFMSMISGFFSSAIGENLIKVSYFTPAYWFIKGNAMVMNAGYGQENIVQLMPILFSQMLFGMAIFCIGLLISKERKNKVD